MKLSEMQVDTDRIEQGAWIESIPDMGDLRLKVRGIGNVSFRAMQAKLFDAVPRSKRVGGRIDPFELDRITRRCLVETILIDWDGITDDDGQPIPYSREMAERLLYDPTMGRFRDAVAWASGVVGDVVAANAEDDAKN